MGGGTIAKHGVFSRPLDEWKTRNELNIEN